MLHKESAFLFLISLLSQAHDLWLLELEESWHGGEPFIDFLQGLTGRIYDLSLWLITAHPPSNLGERHCCVHWCNWGLPEKMMTIMGTVSCFFFLILSFGCLFLYISKNIIFIWVYFYLFLTMRLLHVSYWSNENDKQLAPDYIYLCYPIKIHPNKYIFATYYCCL